MTAIKLCRTEILESQINFPTELSVAGILKEPKVKSTKQTGIIREYVSYEGRITVIDNTKKKGKTKKNVEPAYISKTWSIDICPYYSDVMLSCLKIVLCLDGQLVKTINVPIERGEFWSFIYKLADELTDMSTDENGKIMH